jgi:hypothetical protein
VRIVLGDARRFEVFRDVTHEALRPESVGTEAPDLGLVADEVVVRADGATHLDARSSTAGEG